MADSGVCRGIPPKGRWPAVLPLEFEIKQPRQAIRLGRNIAGAVLAATRIKRKLALYQRRKPPRYPKKKLGPQ